MKKNIFLSSLLIVESSKLLVKWNFLLNSGFIIFGYLIRLFRMEIAIRCSRYE